MIEWKLIISEVIKEIGSLCRKRLCIPLFVVLFSYAVDELFVISQTHLHHQTHFFAMLTPFLKVLYINV